MLAGQSWVHLFNSNAPVSSSAIHNGLECIKAKMKLFVLQDIQHSEEEKEKRQMTFNFRHKILNPLKLEADEGDARIWFLAPAAYNNLLAKYRDYKKNK
ncbi:MAG: hypothetical protein II812_07020 [Prevotella sp.]|nr:hypothetical protein [Prevotella sp.]